MTAPARASLSLCSRSPAALLAVALGLAAACVTDSGGSGSQIITVDGQTMTVDDAAQGIYAEAFKRKDDGDMAGARSLLKDLLDKYPRSKWAGPAALTQAEVLMALDEPAAAQKVLETFLTQQPSHELADDARYQLALAQLAQGDTKAATKELEKKIEKAADPEEKKAAAAELAETLKDSGQASQAAKYQEQVLELTQDPVEKKKQEEELLRLIDEELPFNEVRRIAEAEAKPGTFLDEVVQYKLARIHLHLRDDREALTRLETYIERYPTGRFIEDATKLRDALNKRVVVNPRTVGVLLPLSGVYQGYGQRVLTAVLLGAGLKVDDGLYDKDAGKTGEGRYTLPVKAAAGAPAEPITLVVKDTAGDPQVAQEHVRALVEEEHAIAIIGDILLDTSLPIALKGEELAIPVVSLSRRDGIAELGPFSFRMSFTAEKQARALVKLAMDKLGHKRFAVLYPRHSYGVNMMNAFWDEIDARQGEITAIESYGHDQTTFTPEIRNMVGRAHLDARYQYVVCKNKAKELEDPYRQKKALEQCEADVSPIVDFDALLIPDDYRTVSYILPAFEAEDVLLTNDPYTIAVFRKTTENRKVKPVQLLGGNMWNNPELGKRLKRKIDGAVFVDSFYSSSDVPLVKSFVKRFAGVHRSRPGLLEAHGYDAAALVVTLLTGGAGKPMHNRVDLQQALAKTKEFPGVTGMVQFSANGDSATEPMFFTFEKGRLEVADDIKGKGEG